MNALTIWFYLMLIVWPVSFWLLAKQRNWGTASLAVSIPSGMVFFIENLSERISPINPDLIFTFALILVYLSSPIIYIVLTTLMIKFRSKSGK